MDMPTVYIEKPTDSHEAWAALSRLLDQINALFFLMSAAMVDQDDVLELYHAATLGLELSEEAERRADTLCRFAQRPVADKDATQDPTEL